MNGQTKCIISTHLNNIKKKKRAKSQCKSQNITHNISNGYDNFRTLSVLIGGRCMATWGPAFWAGNAYLLGHETFKMGQSTGSGLLENWVR